MPTISNNLSSGLFLARRVRGFDTAIRLTILWALETHSDAAVLSMPPAHERTLMMARVWLQLYYDFGGDLAGVKREITRIGRIRRLLAALGYKAHEGRSHHEEGVFLNWEIDRSDLMSVLSQLANSGLGPFRGKFPSLIVYGELDPTTKAQVDKLGFNSFVS